LADSGEVADGLVVPAGAIGIQVKSVIVIMGREAWRGFMYLRCFIPKVEVPTIVYDGVGVIARICEKCAFQVQRLYQLAGYQIRERLSCNGLDGIGKNLERHVGVVRRG